jgi:hypothetical protein
VSARRRTRRSARLAPALACLLALATSGCATVRPYEMENLADRIMVPEADTGAAMREMKWLDAREGSTGGVGGAGGGCACK